MKLNHQPEGNMSLISIVQLAILGTMAIVNLLFQSVSLPEPSGKFMVSTTRYILTDPYRKEIYGGQDVGPRRIVIQVWYPTLDRNLPVRAPVFAGGKEVTAGIAETLNLPQVLLVDMAYSVSGSLPNQPIFRGYEYPVVIISHTMKSMAAYHTELAEYLASNGYFVIGIDHGYMAAATFFRSGDVAYYDPNILASPIDSARKLLMQTCKNDIHLVLQTVTGLNSGQLGAGFTGTLDLENIGFIGHGTGAATGIILAFEDNTFKAFVGMDPWMEFVLPGIIGAGLGVPGLLLASEEWVEREDFEKLKIFFDHSTDDRDFFVVPETAHFDFTILGRLSPAIRFLGFTASVYPERTGTLWKDLILVFFNRHLRGI